MSFVHYQVDEHIATLRFSRPDKKNAVIHEMWIELCQRLVEAEADSRVRVIVFTGAGGNFTAGYDLGDFLHQPPIAADSPVYQFLQLVAGATKPLLAAVEGVAVGIGTTLLLHCDFAYVASNARLQMPFVNLALCPEAASSLLVPRLCGQRKAAELLMLGEMFDAQTALSCGLVNGVTEPGDAEMVTMATAKKLSAKPPAALRAAKALLKRSDKSAVLEQISVEAATFTQLLQSAEAKEAFAAFLEKRAPDFSRFT